MRKLMASLVVLSIISLAGCDVLLAPFVPSEEQQAQESSRGVDIIRGDSFPLIDNESGRPISGVWIKCSGDAYDVTYRYMVPTGGIDGLKSGYEVVFVPEYGQDSIPDPKILNTCRVVNAFPQWGVK